MRNGKRRSKNMLVIEDTSSALAPFWNKQKNLVERYKSNRSQVNKSVDFINLQRNDTTQRSLELSQGGSYSNIGEINPSIFLSEDKIINKMRKFA